MENHYLNQSFLDAVTEAQNLLTELAKSPDFYTVIGSAFGSNYSEPSIRELRLDWLTADFSSFPQIELVNSSTLNGANGAFASINGTIYLGTDFIRANSTEATTSLLLEEYGHFLDDRLNTEDSPGDEGSIFAALASDQELSEAELGSLLDEDDSGLIELDGKFIEVEQQVIGLEDNRELVTNPKSPSWSKIGWISAEWDREGQSGDVFGGTGSLFLSPYHVLTAAHVVWDKSEHEASGNGYASSVTVNFGQSEQNRFYGTARVTDMLTFNSWTKDDNWTQNDKGNWTPNSRVGDMALLTLDRNIGDYAGYFGYDQDIYEGQNVKLAGYPTDLADSWSWEHGYSVAAADAPDIGLYQDSDPITQIVDGIIQYEIDTAAGQSGAPVWSYDAATRTRNVVGVHVTGNGSFNSAVSLSQGKINAFEAEIEGSTAPEDLPDLVDYDYWFGTEQAYFENDTTNTSSRDSEQLVISPGDSLTVRSLVRNNGTATSESLAPKVSFYASTDRYIGSLDYFLGEVTLSEIAPFEWEEAILGAVLPDLPEGNYYIGWEIDSDSNVTEFWEDNNDGLLADFTISAE